MTNLNIHAIPKMRKGTSAFFLAVNISDLPAGQFSNEEISYLKKRKEQGESLVMLNRMHHLVLVQFTEDWAKKPLSAQLELARQAGTKAAATINHHKYAAVTIAAHPSDELLYAVAEGMALSSYQFLKYFSDRKKANSLTEIAVVFSAKGKALANELTILVEAVFQARTWVNEPQSWLDAVKLASELKRMAKESGIRCEVLNKKQIEALKMGGLLAVNQGSKTPPTFTMLEYKPTKARNKKPLVLIGKGVVYDTGGLSLKPTPNSMDTMKCDMAGAAAVAAAIGAVAKAKLNYHVIALVPATDNRPGENAYTPGDVVTMFDGQTVEVLNTDAEGRMLLADALAYAKKYKPELVMDFATLTGAAAAAIGAYGTVCMGTASNETKDLLKSSGDKVHERLVEFPFWDDYAALLKSDIADMKNIGGPIAGAITAGKFLEKFTDYPWMHFDIAGPAFLTSPDGYRGKGATGTGVRFLFDYIKGCSELK